MNLALGSTASGSTLQAAAHEVAVRVDAPARLHLGFVDPSGSLGRRYGSLGLAIDTLSTRIRVALADKDSFSAADEASAPLVARARDHLEVLRRSTSRTVPLRVVLERTPPRHAGFGSGTQLALALGCAFARIHAIDLSTSAVAGLLARGARSGIGTAAFDRGGLILDGGPSTDGRIAPLLSRIPFPTRWRIVLALDERQCGLHGVAESEAMARLAPFARSQAADIAHELLMRALPAAAEAAFEPFAESITRIQQSLGSYFAPAQHGSMYTSPDVARLMGWVRRHFRAGIGQSSWGPTGFAIVPSQEVAECVIGEAKAAQLVPEHVRLLVARGCNRGATVTAAASAA